MMKSLNEALDTEAVATRREITNLLATLQGNLEDAQTAFREGQFGVGAYIIQETAATMNGMARRAESFCQRATLLGAQWYHNPSNKIEEEKPR